MSRDLSNQSSIGLASLPSRNNQNQLKMSFKYLGWTVQSSRDYECFGNTVNRLSSAQMT